MLLALCVTVCTVLSVCPVFNTALLSDAAALILEYCVSTELFFFICVFTKWRLFDDEIRDLDL